MPFILHLKNSNHKKKNTHHWFNVGYLGKINFTEKYFVIEFKIL